MSTTDKHHPAFWGLTLGITAAALLYTWQHNVSMAVGGFLIVAYLVWTLTRVAQMTTQTRAMRDKLRDLPTNRFRARLWRLLFDAGYWWSLLFGGAVILGAAWYAGLQDVRLLMIFATLWAVIASLMSFTLTLQYPTTRCRRCRYQLLAHMDPLDPDQHITCPECGAHWSKQQLFLTSAGSPTDTVSLIS